MRMTSIVSRDAFTCERIYSSSYTLIEFGIYEYHHGAVQDFV